MEILEIIKKRKTIRKYTDKPIPKEVLDKILEAGIWGPSVHGLQPWKFVVVTQGQVSHWFDQWTHEGLTLQD